MPAPHFDADAYARSGRCPWTFFAFPRSLANENGWPRDDAVGHLLAAVQNRGVPAGVWVSSVTPGTIYYACPYECRAALDEALLSLAAQYRWEAGFLSRWSDRLFAVATRDPDSPDDRDSQ